MANPQPRPLYLRARDLVRVVQEVGWDSVLVWMGPENLAVHRGSETVPSTPKESLLKLYVLPSK
jgi:hypothetical protein